MRDTPTTPSALSSERRERLLDDARRRLTRLEIETHRLRAELARLEADGEEAAAAELTRRLRQEEAKLQGDPLFEAFDRERRAESYAPRDSMPVAAGAVEQTASEANREPPWRRDAPTEATRETVAISPPATAHRGRAARRRKRKKRAIARMPAWSVSLLTHALFLLTLGVGTFAIQQDTRSFLLANVVDGEESFDDFAEVSLEPTELEELDFEEIVEPLESTDLTESLLDDVQVPLDSAALGRELDAASALDALPSDLTGLMAGPPSGVPDGDAGAGNNKDGGAAGRASAQFFGARARGERFVFVVDNSGSMVDGRMETTIMELLRSIGQMKPQQQFHVLFYSDQVYPMFFPEPVDSLVPATRENRDRLSQWLSTVEMCRGGSLKDAMQLAASLEPHVVYLLSDGDYLFLTRNGRRSMSRTLEYLVSETPDWPFVIHTLGMTVRDRDSAEALSLIAQAHQGVFSPVAVNPLAARMARERQIRYHRTPGPVWGTKVR